MNPIVRSRRLAPRSLRISTALIAALFALSSCGDSTSPEPPTPFTVSGTLSGPQLAALPAGSRVVLLWVVTSSSPDYAYVFGDGTIDAANGRFTMTIADRPPRAALNSYGLGVGIPVVVGPGASIPTGRLDDVAALQAAALGAAGNYAVIYTAAARPSQMTELAWVDAFPLGYGVGRGIILPGTFDGFEPVASTTIEIVIDDMENIEFVNWT